MIQQVASPKRPRPVISICSVEGKIVIILGFVGPYITRNNKFPKSFIDEIQSIIIIGLLMRRLDSLGDNIC